MNNEKTKKQLSEDVLNQERDSSNGFKVEVLQKLKKSPKRR